jgi:2'-5' RNA ligase
MSLGGSGLFPAPKSARVFWAGIQAGPQLARLSSSVEYALAPLGIAREDRPFSPHLTLARTRGASGAPARQKSDAPHVKFSVLQKNLAAMPAPEFGTMTAREFFLYRSQLSSQGSRYSKIARFALGSKSI